MSVKGLSHVNIRADRTLIDRLRDFYVDAVGLRDGDRPPFRNFGYWLYAGDQAIVHLIVQSPGENRVSGKETTLDHFAIECRHLDDAKQRLTDHGVNFEYSEVPLTGQRQLFFQDPAGNGVELLFDANGYDEGSNKN